MKSAVNGGDGEHVFNAVTVDWVPWVFSRGSGEGKRDGSRRGGGKGQREGQRGWAEGRGSGVRVREGSGEGSGKGQREGEVPHALAVQMRKARSVETFRSGTVSAAASGIADRP